MSQLSLSFLFQESCIYSLENWSNCSWYIASWSWEYSQLLVNLWCRASKTVAFSKSTRNDHTYQQMVKKLAAWQIYQTSDQCRERIKCLKSEYQKTRNQNHTLVNLSKSCPFYEEFDQVLGILPSMEPTMVRDDLLSWDGALLTPESSKVTDGRQQQGQSRDTEVCLLLKSVPEQALEQEQQPAHSGAHSDVLMPPHTQLSPAKNSTVQSLLQTHRRQKPPWAH